MAKELTLTERFEWVRDTLQEGSSCSLQLTDEHLADVLFSDFNTDTISALHGSALDELVEAGYISDRVRERCLRIRLVAQALIEEAPRPVTGQFIRESEAWRDLRRYCEETLALLDAEPPR